MWHHNIVTVWQGRCENFCPLFPEDILTTGNQYGYQPIPPLTRIGFCWCHGSCPAINILIVSEYYFEILTGEIVHGDSGLVAVNSKFGWVESGPMQDRRENLDICGKLCNQEDWSSEVRHWQRKWYRTFSSFRKILGYQITRNQRRICHHNKSVRQQINTGIIEECAHQCPEEHNHFLPHHGVVKQDREMTKLREPSLGTMIYRWMIVYGRVLTWFYISSIQLWSLEIIPMESSPISRRPFIKFKSHTMIDPCSRSCGLTI